MPGKLEYLTKSIINTPLLATEETVHSALSFLENRWQLNSAFPSLEGTSRPSVDVSEGNVAFITLYGPMMRRAMGLEALCGALGYDDYRMQFDSAFDNPDVDVVVLSISSGGGEASGLFDLAQHIYDKKKESGKKMIAYVEDVAASAAYALASVADEIIMEKTAEAGSIGVITTHADVSKKLEKEGVVITPIYAGEFKAAGNPYEALSEEVKTMIQERVDTLYNVFVSHVADMRGISDKDVRATQAKTFLAEEAIELGLADKIMSTDEFMAYLENDEDSTNFSLKTVNNSQEKLVKSKMETSDLEAMQSQLAELSQVKEKLAAFEKEKTELAEQLTNAKSLLDQKLAVEQTQKLEGLKQKAETYKAFGLDADKFANLAMKADEGFVSEVLASLSKAKEQLEASASFSEVGVDAEGQGVAVKEHPATAHAKKQYQSKESK